MTANKIILNEQQNKATAKAVFERLEKVINGMSKLTKKADWTEAQTARYKALDEERKALRQVLNML